MRRVHRWRMRQRQERACTLLKHGRMRPCWQCRNTWATPAMPESRAARASGSQRISEEGSQAVDCRAAEYDLESDPGNTDEEREGDDQEVLE